jgi:hypothetical protein
LVLLFKPLFYLFVHRLSDESVFKGSELTLIASQRHANESKRMIHCRCGTRKGCYYLYQIPAVEICKNGNCRGAVQNSGLKVIAAKAATDKLPSSNKNIFQQ